MIRNIRARVRRGLIEPLEPINVPDGTEVTVTIPDDPSAADREAFRSSAGSWAGLIDAEALIRDLYDRRLTGSRPETRP